MSAPATIAPAAPGQAADLIGVICRGLPPRVQHTTIYGCPGADAFVRREIELGPALAERAYTVAVAEGRVVGAIELRRLARTLFLNYVSVSPEHGGGGIATALLHAATAALRAPAHESMLLDVFRDNRVARAWYDALGFRPNGEETEWWELDLPPAAAPPAAATIVGWAQAEACHAAFGFSQVTVETEDGRYAVGRMGGEWFRLTQPEALADPAFAPLLGALDPRRRLIAIVPAGSLPARVVPAARLTARGIRLSAGLPELMSHLDERAARRAQPPATTAP